MHKIEYEIKLNEFGRPYIELSKDYEDNPEDKFMMIELATYFIRTSFNNQSHNLDEKSKKQLSDTLDFLLDIGDNMSKIIFDNMKAAGELFMMINNGYHIFVKNIEERDALPDENIVYNNKIFNRVEGLIVMITCYDKNDYSPYQVKYQLVGGISNEHWVKLKP